MSRVPVVRHLVPCERVERLPAGSVTLHGVFHTVPARPETTYPRVVETLAAYVQMSDGTGTHRFQTMIVYLDDETLCYFGPERTLDLGSHPLATHHWHDDLPDVTFSTAGLYEVRLMCDGNVIAQEANFLRRATR